MRNKEALVFKERDKLELHIKTFKSQKAEHDHKHNLLTQQYIKLNMLKDKLNKEKEIANYENTINSQLNFVLSNNAKMSIFNNNNNNKNSHYKDEKLAEINHKKISSNNMTNITLPTSNVTNSWSSNNNNNNIKLNSHKSSVDYKKDSAVFENSKSKSIFKVLIFKK